MEPVKPKKSKKRRGQSTEPWETEYFHRELPTIHEEEITAVVKDCKEEDVERSKDRKEIMKCVRRKLS